MSVLRHAFEKALLAVALIAPFDAARAQAPVAAYSVPDSETGDPPTSERLHSIEEAAASQGWVYVSAPLRDAAMRAFAQNRFIAADAWFHVFGWSTLFAEPDNQYTEGWIGAVRSSAVNYEGVAGTYTATGKPLGSAITPQTQAWLIENAAFSEEFFSLIKRVDYLPRVLGILDGLRKADPAKFERYSSLALAIAIVYDVAPPPFWPHSQVDRASLPRKLPNPADPFERLTREDALGHTYFRMNALRAEELKFVVDAAAPSTELQWSEQAVPPGLERLEGAYTMIRYREDRAADPSLITWKGSPYTLQNILAQGGICVDQAYFASEAGKARGVPTLLFTGSGQDGRHAWFGYLDQERKWRLDAGRYAEQRLVTGNALDPQTWTVISDHELQFLSERFRALPSFAQSRVQEEFARDFLETGDPQEAARAARRAVNFEKRNLDAWETLIAANARTGMAPSGQEGVYREAALAFTPNYPDLVGHYENKVCTSLRARDETSLADFEERGIAERQRGDRDDLAVRQAAMILARSLSTQAPQDQIATYNAILAQFGPGSGTLFFDEIVTAFAEHLALAHMRPQARESVERARQVLNVQPGTQLAMDVDKLLTRLQD
ncbi:MAG TPA: hypothetical protein VII43_04715 [Opitutaceae bacterium]